MVFSYSDGMWVSANYPINNISLPAQISFTDNAIAWTDDEVTSKQYAFYTISAEPIHQKNKSIYITLRYNT